MRSGRDTAPLANTWVVLHRITRDGGAPIDSVRSDARGRYRIELQHPDSTGVYVVSAWYDSLAYFSSPINVDHPAAHADDIVAYATTANAPPIKLARRLATIAHPGQDGTREILEILELENTGQTARITRDTLVPTWAGRVSRSRPCRTRSSASAGCRVNRSAVPYRLSRCDNAAFSKATSPARAAGSPPSAAGAPAARTGFGCRRNTMGEPRAL